MNIKHIIIGDAHGHYHNVRELLIRKEVINYKNERINKDTIQCYSVGDLIDGDMNYSGDHLLLEHAPEWFDKIAIGNHEFSFLGGPEFRGLRQHDRDLARRLFNLEHQKLYVPAFLVENYLVVHAGVAARWNFLTAPDALCAINHVWDLSNGVNSNGKTTGEFPMLDWIGPARAGQGANDTGGIFWLDWTEARAANFNQIVGHTPITSGPTRCGYVNGVEHWNLDVGGKYGYGLGGVEIENGHISPFFWGREIKFVDPKEDAETVEETEEVSEVSFEPDEGLWQEVDWELNPTDPADDYREMCKNLLGA